MAKSVICFVLAGGKGTRLGGLTKRTSKPSVYFGGKYRLIDFVLSNLANSSINNVNVLIQYESVEISSYCGNGKHWGFDGSNCKFNILSPRQKEDTSYWYNGTADAVYQNLDVIDENLVKYVLIVSADHIYKMNYSYMIEYARKVDADLVVATTEVNEKDISKYGIVKLDENNNIISFKEKPKSSTSNLASMGIYVFKYKVLKDLLLKDAKKEKSKHDFGKDIIPTMIKEDRYQVNSFRFTGYWRDVGTLDSLWEANMDLIDNNDALKLYTDRNSFKVYSEDTKSFPQYIGPNASVKNSIINQGSTVYGSIIHSVLFTGTEVGQGSLIEYSVIMPNAKIGNNVKMRNAIVATNVEIEDNRELVFDEVTLVTK